ncbi:helix-turn-helix domain-containing protein [Spirosoma sp. 209]|uniref:helix-turn-helix domain-containing protein n=1 Tax=Spirosoma sp. 209 TaxID=1955701 RepID=UPI00098D59F1|nr:helix-turn-helix transcriptional regulator [Spirosoma sp. 209]
MDISNNIKAIRTAKGMSQAEIARRLELDPSAYHRLENRGSKLSVDQIEEIAIALGVSFSEVLKWGEDKTNTIDQERLDKLEQDLGKADELLKLQREKIEYLQSTCAQIIVRMAADEFELESKLTIVENIETKEIEHGYPEDWPMFLSNFLIANDWAYSLIDNGLTGEHLVLKSGTGYGSSVPVPRDILRKLAKRRKADSKSVDGAF